MHRLVIKFILLHGPQIAKHQARPDDHDVRTLGTTFNMMEKHKISPVQLHQHAVHVQQI